MSLKDSSKNYFSSNDNSLLPTIGELKNIFEKIEIYKLVTL